ncbi:MAG: hypothetical protein ACYS17_16565, partial [Planctomycetota bacterium]
RSVFIPAATASLCGEQDQFSPIVGVDSNNKSGSFMLKWNTNTNPHQKSTKSSTFFAKKPLFNVLPAVRSNFNHSGTSCLHDSMMLLLAFGSTNYLQKTVKNAHT